MNATKFRQQAIRARRLSLSIGDKATSDTLKKYAEECDGRAADITAREKLFRLAGSAARREP